MQRLKLGMDKWFHLTTWWRHQMETFSALLAICAGNSPVPGEFPAQRPVRRSFDVFFDQRLNKRLSKQSWGWWFETLSRSLWRHHNEILAMWLPFIAGFDLNSSPPSAAYMRQWIGSALWLVAYWAPSHYLNQCWVIVYWVHRNKLQWNFNQNTKFFIHKNASDNTVCEMAAILSTGDEF